MKCHALLVLVAILGLTMTQAVPASEPAIKEPSTKEPSIKEPVLEKKSVVKEAQVAKKIDITESIPAIAVEGAEEPKQADRTKKSATTTFCVEIRPGPSEAPVKVCENPPPPPPPVPQVPHEAHEIIEPPPPPPPTYIHEQQQPIFIIPPNPQEIYIPNEPCPPTIPAPQPAYIHYPQVFHQPPPPPPQHVIIPTVVSNPCPPSPCAPTNGAGLQPHALLTLFRSAMAPMNGALASIDGLQMRSNNEEFSSGLNSGPIISTGMDSGATQSSGITSGAMVPLGMDSRAIVSSNMDSGALISSGMEPNQGGETDAVETPFARTHVRKHYGVPQSSVYSSSAYNQRTPYIVRCNPQLVSLGNGGSAYIIRSGQGRSADGAFNAVDSNGQPMIASDGQMIMDMSNQARHHVIHPVVQPYISGYPSHQMVPSVVQHTTYQSFPSSLNSYPHSPGYPVHHQQPGIIPPSISINAHPGSYYRSEQFRHQQQPASFSPGTSSFYRSEQEHRQQQSAHQQKQHEQEKSSVDQQKNRSEQFGSMSPSQMINQMRGSGTPSSFNKRPTMQSFPRITDAKSSSDCFTTKMNIPRGSQSFMISGPRHSRDDNDSAMQDGRGAMHEDMDKRETEKSVTEEKD